MPSNLPTDPILQDFNRDVWCLFGLPVDNLTMESTKKLLREKAEQEGSIVLSTINVNWVVQSFKDPAFRAAILNSDIVTLDGRPLLWLAKTLGYPMKEVVAGSSLIDELNNEKSGEKPLTLFLFGGEDGVAAQAMEKVNKNRGGLRVVGYYSPGFGSVEEMSKDEIIAAINATKPDILLVALGAKKGMQWIEHNRNRLNAKIFSHLGATINFLAGSVDRAPGFIQKIGMEWGWRILQEPALFSRYAGDGLIILKLLLSSSFLWVRFLWWQRKYRGYHTANVSKNIVQQQENGQSIILTFGKNIIAGRDFSMREIFSACAGKKKNIILDFQETGYCDGAFLSQLLILKKYQLKHCKVLEFVGVSNLLNSIFKLFSLSLSNHL